MCISEYNICLIFWTPVSSWLRWMIRIVFAPNTTFTYPTFLPKYLVLKGRYIFCLIIHNMRIYCILTCTIHLQPCKTYLYTVTWIPVLVSSLILRTFFSLCCSGVSFRAALASWWALSLFAICSRTCFSILVGSRTASVPSTLIRLAIRTWNQNKWRGY